MSIYTLNGASVPKFPPIVVATNVTYPIPTPITGDNLTPATATNNTFLVTSAGSARWGHERMPTLKECLNLENITMTLNQNSTAVQLHDALTAAACLLRIEPNNSTAIESLIKVIKTNTWRNINAHTASEAQTKAVIIIEEAGLKNPQLVKALADIVTTVHPSETWSKDRFNPDLREHCAKALAKIADQDQTAHSALHKVFYQIERKKPYSGAQIAAAKGLKQTAFLEKGLNDNNLTIKAKCAKALLEIDPGTSRDKINPIVQELLNNITNPKASYIDRISSAFALGETGDSSIVDNLKTEIHRCNDGRPKGNLILALGKVGAGNQSAISFLNSIITDSTDTSSLEYDPKLFSVAALANTAGIGNAEAIAAVSDYLDQIDNKLKQLVAKRLLIIDPGNDKATQLLLNIASNQSPDQLSAINDLTELWHRSKTAPVIDPRSTNVITDFTSVDYA